MRRIVFLVFCLVFVFCVSEMYATKVGHVKGNVVVFASHYLQLENVPEMVSKVDEAILRILKSRKGYSVEAISFRLSEENFSKLMNVVRASTSGKSESIVLSDSDFGEFLLTPDTLNKILSSEAVIVPRITKLNLSSFFRISEQVSTDVEAGRIVESKKIVQIPYQLVILKMNVTILDPKSLSVMTNLVIDVNKEIESKDIDFAIESVISNEFFEEFFDLVGYRIGPKVLGTKGNRYIINVGINDKVMVGEEFLVVDNEVGGKKYKGVVKVVSVGDNTSEVIPVTLFTRVFPGDTVIESRDVIFNWFFIGFQQVFFDIPDTNLVKYFDIVDMRDGRGEVFSLGLGFVTKGWPIDIRSNLYFLFTKPFSFGISFGFGIPLYLWRLKFDPYLGIDYFVSLVSTREDYPTVNLRNLTINVHSWGVLGGLGLELRFSDSFSFYSDVGAKFTLPVIVYVPGFPSSFFGSSYVPILRQNGLYATVGFDIKF